MSTTSKELKLLIIQNCEKLDYAGRMTVLRHLIDAIDLPARICQNGDGSRINLDLLCSGLLLELNDFVDDLARPIPPEFEIG